MPTRKKKRKEDSHIINIGEREPFQNACLFDQARLSSDLMMATFALQ